MVDNRSVKELLVPLLHRGEGHVAVQVAGQISEPGHHAIDELRLRRDDIRKQALQSKMQALLAREGDGLVARFVVKDVEAFLRHDDSLRD